MKRLLIFCLFVSCCFMARAGNNFTWSERMAQSEMKRFPEPWMIERAKKPFWGYTHGLVVKSMLEEWKHTGKKVYYSYARIYADSLIDKNGRIKTMKFTSFNIDNINAGKILFDFYEQTGDRRYKAALDTLMKQLDEQPRTSEGGFWHKLRYPHQMWLDGIFMASPFLAEYGKTFNRPACYAEAVRQICLIARKTYDPETGLYYHGWDESHTQKWANPATGCSSSFWSRSIGWYSAALVDVLDYLPENVTGRDNILHILRSLVPAITRYQDSRTGTWYQVTNQGKRKGNYLESSASSLFAYTLAKAIRKGYVSKSYRKAADKAFNGLISTFIKKEKDGTYTITNCCAVAGLGGNYKKERDGSFEYYIGEPVINNDPKSVGAFILAAIEYERLQQMK